MLPMATVAATQDAFLRGSIVVTSRSFANFTPSFHCAGLHGSSFIRFRHKSRSPGPRGALSTRAFHTSPAVGSRSRISYRIAVASSGKGRASHPKRNAYIFDPKTHDAIGIEKRGSYLQRKLSRVDSGEDAFFVSKVGDHDDAVAFGVADGVGGWTESGVDPADFSHGFCTHMAEAALKWELPPDKLRPTALMQAGYDRSLNDKRIVAGGSTACIGVGDENGTVQLANLGDSGSVLFRLAAVHHYSMPQTHGFNAPYQLSVLPPLLRIQTSMFGGRQYEDLPPDSNVTNLQMRHGDVLLLATDGVFDNLNNQELLKLITRQMMATGAWNGTADMGIGVTSQLNALTQPGDLSSSKESGNTASGADRTPNPHTNDYPLSALLALAVAREAKMTSMDLRRDGPFAKESRRYWPSDPWRGGKPDDICALVVVAVEEGREDT